MKEKNKILEKVISACQVYWFILREVKIQLKYLSFSNKNNSVKQKVNFDQVRCRWFWSKVNNIPRLSIDQSIDFLRSMFSSEKKSKNKKTREK